MKLLILLCAVICLTGCTPDARNSESTLDSLPLHTSPDGMHYKLIKIEGKTFVATTGANNWWALAGPID